jgi:hypothetical protein
MIKYSISIFGSSLRDDFDKYSDKDLLVVAEDFETLEKLKKQYSKEDWSVSYYTYSKLEFLSENGSLFIKHLQDGSRSLVDHGSKLSKIISNFKSRDSYITDYKESKNYFEIIKVIPDSNFGYAWFCDCLYVGLRNLLIFENAAQNVYEFSYLKLLDLLRENGKISESESNILKELRVVKRNYREDILDEFPSKSFVQKVIPIAKNIGLIDSFVIIDSISFQEYVEKHIKSKKFNPYQRLRLVEGYYSSQNQFIPELKKIISNPQFYASKLKDDDYTMQLILKIKDFKQHSGKNVTKQWFIANKRQR